MDADETLITTAELARRLGLASRTIAMYAQKGYSTPALVTPGGQYRWKHDDVVAEMHELARKRREEER